MSQNQLSNKLTVTLSLRMQKKHYNAKSLAVWQYLNLTLTEASFGNAPRSTLPQCTPQSDPNLAAVGTCNIRSYAVLAKKNVKSFPSPTAHWVALISISYGRQPDTCTLYTSVHCETTDTGPVYRAVACLRPSGEAGTKLLISNMYIKNVKFFPSLTAHRAALISAS